MKQGTESKNKKKWFETPHVPWQAEPPRNQLLTVDIPAT